MAEPLSDLDKGKSETSVESPLSRVRTGSFSINVHSYEAATGSFSINVHSYEGGYPVVACVNIPAG